MVMVTNGECFLCCISGKQGFFMREIQVSEFCHHLNIVLVEPEIPPNTGNIARMCAATMSTLHLIHPLGFRTDDRSLRRAGLDYWKYVDVVHHSSLDAFLEEHGHKELLLFTKKAETPYTKAPYSPSCWLLFGRETMGLPRPLLEKYSRRTYSIPMRGDRVRSLNLATAAGIVTYEAYRQLNHW